MYFLDPTNDLAFRKIFGNENKKEILISFLNSILKLKDNKRIKDINIIESHQIPKIRELKETILDVYCEDERGINYIVELQIAKPSAFEKRTLYYTSKAYVNQLETGNDYPLLNQVIFLGIINFNIFDKNEDYISNHLILDEKTYENKLKDFRFCFVELPKFNKTEAELRNIEDKWIYFLKYARKLEVIPEKIKEKEIIEAFEALNRFYWSKEELLMYDKIAIRRQDERGWIENALEEGKEMGIKEGKEMGIKEGKIEIAKNLLDILDLETISSKTGLSIEEIKQLT